MNSKSFPEKSIVYARDIASKYRQRTKSKLGIAKLLYDRNFYHVGYGFDESLKTGNCGRFPHEIIKKTECFTMTGLLYLIAKEAKLNPIIYSARSVRDEAYGENSFTPEGADHSFIICKGWKNIIVDPFMSLLGEVKFFSDKNKMEIRDRKGIFIRNYKMIEELSEKEYLEKLEKQRTSEGGRIALSVTQKVENKHRSIYVTYLPETQTIKSSIHYSEEPFRPNYYERSSIIDLETAVKNDGSFSFQDGEFSLYKARSSGWSEHLDPHIPIIFKFSDAEILFRIWNNFLEKTGRKSPINLMGGTKVMSKLIGGGFKNNFGIVENSFAQETVNENRVNWRNILDWKEEIIRDYILRTKEDEISYKILLRESIKTGIKDKKISKKNPHGFIFSFNEHDRYLKETFGIYKKDLLDYYNDFIEFKKIKYGLKKGKTFLAEKRLQKSGSQKEYLAEGLNRMGIYKKRHSFPTFNILIDEVLFDKKFKLDEMIVDKIEKDVGEDSLKHGAQRILFCDLVSAWRDKDALMLKQYKKGLKKILNKEK